MPDMHVRTTAEEGRHLREPQVAEILVHVHDAGVDAEGGVVVLHGAGDVAELRENRREVVARVCKVGLQLERRLHGRRRVGGSRGGPDEEQRGLLDGDTPRMPRTEDCHEISLWATTQAALCSQIWLHAKPSRHKLGMSTCSYRWSNCLVSVPASRVLSREDTGGKTREDALRHTHVTGGHVGTHDTLWCGSNEASEHRSRTWEGMPRPYGTMGATFTL